MQCVILVLPVEAEMEGSHRHICRAFQSKPALAVDDCRRDWDVYGLVSANHNFRVPMDACTLLGKQERNVRRYGLAVASGQRGRPVPFARNVWHSTAYSQRTREMNNPAASSGVSQKQRELMIEATPQAAGNLDPEEIKQVAPNIIELFIGSIFISFPPCTCSFTETLDAGFFRSVALAYVPTHPLLSFLCAFGCQSHIRRMQICQILAATKSSFNESIVRSPCSYGHYDGLLHRWYEHYASMWQLGRIAGIKRGSRGG